MSKSKCPYCSTIGCYNSGFTVECVNLRCKFYSYKQKAYMDEEKKKSLKESDIIVSSSTSGSYTLTLPTAGKSVNKVVIPKTSSSPHFTAGGYYNVDQFDMDDYYQPGPTQDDDEQSGFIVKNMKAYEDEIARLMQRYNLSYREAKQMYDYNVDL